MINTLNLKDGVVVATVTHVAVGKPFFFARNCDPRGIFCHLNQGGFPVICADSSITLGRSIGELPKVGDKIVLLRESQNPNTREYTKASAWMTADDWQRAKWAKDATKLFRVFGCNHRTNGHFQSNTNTDVELASGTLYQIVKRYSRTATKDTLADGYKVRLPGMTLTQRTRWERWDNGKQEWVACKDPRPTYPVHVA